VKKLYIIGSLRNPKVLEVDRALSVGLPEWEIFSDWMCAGEHADDAWQAYEKARGKSFLEGLQGYSAKHIFAFDKHHLDTADMAVLVLPAGKSACMELGYMAGRGKRTAILLDDPDRWDCMFQFADLLTYDVEDIIRAARGPCPGEHPPPSNL
jgi:hypothetical protein